VVVALKAAALNHLDLFVLGGMPGLTLAFPHILGADGAGVVEAVGGDVTELKPGDHVVLNPGLSCRVCATCRAGEHSMCPTYHLLGEHVNGTFAGAIRVPAENAVPIPARVPWADAAAFPLVFLTAWRMLATRAALRAGETVLIWGIGGGVALAALQIAKLRGARVLVTSSSDAKLERARALGADATINHASADVPREVRRLTDKRGADVVLETVGAATWDRSVRLLARGGRLVTCGATSGPDVGLDVRRVFWHHLSLLGSTMGNDEEFRQVVALLAQGVLRPVVDTILPLRAAGEAFARLASGNQFGKLVLDIAAQAAGR
jgi:NADPH:quinone reductase-like Zn-dependent oxidoreductase